MDYFTLSDLVQVLEDTMTYEEIEIFLSTKTVMAVIPQMKNNNDS